METKDELIKDISKHHPSSLAVGHYGTILVAKALLVLVLVLQDYLSRK